MSASVEKLQCSIKVPVKEEPTSPPRNGVYQAGSEGSEQMSVTGDPGVKNEEAADSGDGVGTRRNEEKDVKPDIEDGALPALRGPMWSIYTRPASPPVAMLPPRAASKKKRAGKAKNDRPALFFGKRQVETPGEARARKMREQKVLEKSHKADIGASGDGGTDGNAGSGQADTKKDYTFGFEMGARKVKAPSEARRLKIKMKAEKRRQKAGMDAEGSEAGDEKPIISQDLPGSGPTSTSSSTTLPTGPHSPSGIDPTTEVDRLDRDYPSEL